MQSLTIQAGRDKQGSPEAFDSLTLHTGELCTIVGNTGSGKSRLIKDVEQLANGDSVTSRTILLDGAPVPHAARLHQSAHLIAHLGQNMRFMLDTTVAQFIKLHAQCRACAVSVSAVVALANEITPEPILPDQNLNLLSGGQTRALMIADIALICDSPIVLIDEIENAGVDKEKALSLLQGRDKLVLVVTHDPHTALMAPRRVVMQGGAVTAIVERTPEEVQLYTRLSQAYRLQQRYQTALRKGEHLT